MSARRLDIGIRSRAERSKALREALRRVASGDLTQPPVGNFVCQAGARRNERDLFKETATPG